MFLLFLFIFQFSFRLPAPFLSDIISNRNKFHFLIRVFFFHEKYINSVCMRARVFVSWYITHMQQICAECASRKLSNSPHQVSVAHRNIKFENAKWLYAARMQSPWIECALEVQIHTRIRTLELYFNFTHTLTHKVV